MRITLRFSSNLTFLLQLSFAFAIPPLILPTLTESNTPNEGANATAPVIASPSNPVGFIPAAPYEYHVRESNMIIKFDGYRGKLPAGNVVLCLLNAANRVNMNFGSTESIKQTIQTKWGRVRLKVIPAATGALTWEQWGTAIRGITGFVTTYEYMDMDFYIIVNGQIIGGGLISDQ